MDLKPLAVFHATEMTTETAPDETSAPIVPLAKFADANEVSYINNVYIMCIYTYTLEPLIRLNMDEPWL
jgi:hypothetical protein